MTYCTCWCSICYSHNLINCHMLVLGHIFSYFQRHVVENIVEHIEAEKSRRHFADDVFKRIFLNENVLISIKISLKFVPKGPINNMPALVQIMAWCRPGDKPFSEPRMVSLLTHICVTRPQWVKVWLTTFDHEPGVSENERSHAKICAVNLSGERDISRFHGLNSLRPSDAYMRQ